jgi:hypothetical protein
MTRHCRRLDARAPLLHHLIGAHDRCLGADTAFGRRLFNRPIRPMVFSDLMGPAWLKHNVEEVGNFEHFLPALFALEAR